MPPRVRLPRIALASLLLVGPALPLPLRAQPIPAPPPQGDAPASSPPSGTSSAPLEAPPQNPNTVVPSANEGPLAEARRAYDEGTTHYVAGRYQEALRAFERAYTLRPNPVVLLPILECHDHLGHVPEAIRALETYLAAVPGGRNRPLLEARLASLRQRPARVHVVTAPPGARVEIDGVEQAQRSPTSVELPAGRHTVTVSAPGYLTSSHEFEVQPGTTRDEVLTLEVDPSVQPATSSTGARPSANTPTRGTNPLVWIAAGLAGVGLTAGTTFGVLALRDNNLYDIDPTQETRDRGLRYALLSDVSFGVAVASGVLAVVVYFIERARPLPEPRALTVVPAARLQMAPAGLRVEF